ncbi:hypothetical protein [Propionibacterium australiense]|uniref:Prokaryotic membrane lipoprotein lipid attachment site profile n=1 Tax=Propionibacterium australiense TaxID=119981 RepID=A0A383S8M4_9ACTN|nr:hypothetical protein [Propionibacterium australiense]RLP07645.1 hypothetical protein D7U36_10615 [Propionibacterium australiense]SYZ33729.1 Hypothetical protein PROPAUS_1649 [Propionibacterium australiense]VEH92797.1 Uncharacterised protein [Propionibacterium australiense]
MSTTKTPMRRRAGLAAALASLMSVLCVAACTASPSSPPPRSTTGPSTQASTAAYDFSPFAEQTYEQVEVSDDPARVTAFLPELNVSEAHSMAASREDPRSIPGPDPQYWLNAVVTLEQDSVEALAERVDPHELSTLPALAPELQQYVPSGCTFTRLPLKNATPITGATPAGTDSFKLTAFSLSADCSTAIIMAEIVF